MIQIENTFFELANSCTKDCLIICDRGTMDASACESYLYPICIYGITGKLILTCSYIKREMGVTDSGKQLEQYRIKG